MVLNASYCNSRGERAMSKSGTVRFVFAMHGMLHPHTLNTSSAESNALASMLFLRGGSLVRYQEIYFLFPVMQFRTGVYITATALGVHQFICAAPSGMQVITNCVLIKL